MQRSNRFKTALVLVTVFAGCDAPGSEPAEQPASQLVLKPFTTLRLEERDTAYLGRPNSLAVSAKGEFFVTDLLSSRILRFDPTGSFVEAIGRRGGGPNEFEGPGRLTSVDDSTLAIVDLQRREVVVWDLAARAARLRLPFSGIVSAVVESDGALYAADPDVQNGTAGIRWSLPDAATEHLGEVADVYKSRYWAIWGTPAVDVSGDSIFYFGGSSEYLILADRWWQPRDSIPIPKTLRRGIPREINYQLRPGQNIYDIMKQVSIPVGLAILSGDRYAVLHFDGTVLGNGISTGQVFMTVVSFAESPRCVDVPVPTHKPGAVPRPYFVADTLFVLDQYIVGDSARVEVSKYHVGPNVC